MTIEIPTVSAELLSQLETAHIEATEGEQDAVAAIRLKLTPYAKHNGFIRIARHRTFENSGRELADREWFLGIDGAHVYEAEGRRVRALLAADCFGDTNDTEFTGENTGQRLYLTERGEWIEIARRGRWSNWQGSPYWWTCGVDLTDDGGYGSSDMSGGSIRTITDSEVVAEYNLASILEQLGKSMAEMSKKLPDRYKRLQERAALARNVVEALAKA